MVSCWRWRCRRDLRTRADLSTGKPASSWRRPRRPPFHRLADERTPFHRLADERTSTFLQIPRGKRRLKTKNAMFPWVKRQHRSGNSVFEYVYHIFKEFFLLYSKDHNKRSPPLTFRTYQIRPHTNSYFHCLYSCLDLLPLVYPRGAKPHRYPRSYWRRSR